MEGCMKRDRKFVSILDKLRISFLTPFLVLLLAIMFILGVQYRKREVDAEIRQVKYEDEILAQTLEARIQNTKSCVNTIIIFLNEVLGTGNLDEDGCPLINNATMRKIYDCMVGTFTTFYNAEQVMVVWKNGTVWYENWTENYFMGTEGKPVLSEMEALGVDKKGRWLREISADSKIKGEGCFFAKQYVEIATGKRLGYVILKTGDIFESIEKADSEKNIYVYDEQGMLMYGTSGEALTEQELHGKLEDWKTDRRHNVNEMELENGWSMISVTDMTEAMEELTHTIIIIMMACILIMILTFLIINQIVVRIMKPVQQLSQHMTDFQEQLPAPIQIPVQNDEIGVLVTRFNEMAGHNKELVGLLLEEKKQQEQLKLSLLQAQIKPHFLYNTLDTIYCLVVMGKAEEGSRMTKLLSEYYRYVLNQGLDWILLSEEVEQIRNYLDIQSIRYRDTLDFVIRKDPKTENIKIPKLTLQPLVENAIYHGIKPTGRKGTLEIEILQQGKTVLLRVRDNGAGMSKERFYDILSGSGKTSEGFGIRNVAQRLRIYYGDRCGMAWEDCPQGTSIVIRIVMERAAVKEI